MSTDPMNDYRNAMEETRLSPDQRERLENAVAQARLRETAKPSRQHAPRMVTRRAFAIGAAAAFVGLAGFGAMSAINATTKGPVNSFGLKAYALDDPARPSGYTETLTKNVLTSNVGGYFGMWEDEHGNPVEDTLGYAFRLDLECIGENVASYAYRIEGDQAYFGIGLFSGPIPEDVFPDGSFRVKKYDCSDSFVVTKENQGEFGPDAAYVPLIVLALKMDDEFQAAYDAACSVEHTGASYDVVNETGNELDRLIELHAARRISECSLHVTANYEDGSCETKTYKIAPVGDFEERYLAFQAECDEARLKEMSGEATDSYPDDPELYTIAEIA